MNNIKNIKVEATLMWPFLDTPNPLSGKYQVDIARLSDNAVRALEDMGVKVHNKDEKGFYVTAKSANYPIKAVGKDGQPIVETVGNGSKAIALLKPYVYTYKGKQGVGIGIGKLVVTDLVAYGAGDEDDDDSEVL